VEQYAPDPAARDRILRNRFYRDLAGGLAGILEYMAVERLFEIAQSGRYQRIILDTPPTRQALDFLEAPQRIVAFLDSGALKLGLKPWFDARGKFRPPGALAVLGRPLEAILDEVVGIEFLRELSEFFQAFGPLYSGFRERATQVELLLQAEETLFLLVTGPGEERVPDALFFARKLEETGHRVGPLIVNRVHPPCPPPRRSLAAGEVRGRELLAWLGERDRRGLVHLRSLVPAARGVVALPLLAKEPTDVKALALIGAELQEQLAALSTPS
jgi:anion-transporting  ArsA/GET3 family ATPase